MFLCPGVWESRRCLEKVISFTSSHRDPSHVDLLINLLMHEKLGKLFVPFILYEIFFFSGHLVTHGALIIPANKNCSRSTYPNFLLKDGQLF